MCFQWKIGEKEQTKKRSFLARRPLACYCFGSQPSFFFKVNSHIYRIQEYQEYLQMEKQLLEELGIIEESDDQPEV